MDEKEKELEFTLEDIMKEFSADPGAEMEEAPAEEADVAKDAPEEATEELPEESPGETVVTGDTVRIELPTRQESEEKEAPAPSLGDTVRIGDVAAALEQASETQRVEPFSESWEPEYEQPIGDYVPPAPIIFHPRSRLRELKRKLVAGPERRYYELGEQGTGKLQAALVLSVLVVLLCAGSTALYALNMVPESRLKLMIFGQFLAMLLSALLGCYQLMEGVADIFRGRFSLNSMLFCTLVACCIDGVFCLQQLRVPCCAAFSLQVTMSLWDTYNRRNSEMRSMDTMRKANHLDSIATVPDHYDGCTGLLRGEGQVEDFMDRHADRAKPDKIMGNYGCIALGISTVIGIVAGVHHRSVSFGVQVLSVSMLAAMPVTSFILLSRPAAILQKRLQKLGSVLCGWQGVEALSGRAVFPLTHEDLFPAGTCKLNGVKFYGSRDPDQVVAYCTAVVDADGGGLAPLFDQLLLSRNGRHYFVDNLRAYGNGGIGGEVCGLSVLIGGSDFLQEMGVEIPEGTSVNQAVYAAIDGELCGVFAVSYGKLKSSTAGLRTLCGYRGLRPVLTASDFMLTEEFLAGRFGVNTRRMCFPSPDVRKELSEATVPEEANVAALVTTEGLAPFAYAVTGARSLRSAARIGMVISMVGGIVGLLMMLALAILGAQTLLTPLNMFLYELVWLIPGMLVTEWTRSL